MKATRLTLTPRVHGGLTTYLTGVAGFTAALAAPQADAAVTAVTFGFGPTFNAADGISLWSVGGYGIMYGRANNSASIVVDSILNLGGGDYGVTYLATGPYASLPQFFANGTVIGGGGNGNLGTAFWRSEGNYAATNLDFTSDQLNKNIGFQTSTGNWGYANVSWTEATKTLAINSAFVESEVGTPITIVPEPGVATLLVLGAVAAARGRRRERTTLPAAQD